MRFEPLSRYDAPLAAQCPQADAQVLSALLPRLDLAASGHYMCSELVFKPILIGMSTMKMCIIASFVLSIVVQCVVPTDARARQTASSATKSCEPVFETTQFHRGVPHFFVDQGFASLAHTHPKHLLLVQRRLSELGEVIYSLLIFKPDASKVDVTITGMATHNMQAWSFTARCLEENVTDGIVTTLERIAKL